MISPRFALLTLLASSSLASAGAHGNHVRIRRGDDVTTTSTEVIYVTITQTITTSGDYYPTVLTPSITTTSTTTIEEATDTPYPTETPYTTDTPYPTETPCPTDTTTIEDSYTVEVPSNMTYPTVSGGYTSTIRANQTTYATYGPSVPTPYGTEGAAGTVKAGSAVALMAFVGAVVAML